MSEQRTMRSAASRWYVAAGLAAALMCPELASAQSSITGTVIFDGKTPNLPKLAMDAEPVCLKKHSGPVVAETLVLGPGNAMANIMVHVTKGVPGGKTWPVPKEPVTLDQNGCVYKPHVMGIRVSQPYRILNSDGVLHNIHTLPKLNKTFNKGMPGSMKETTTTFDKPEPMFQIKCDVHPWMISWIGVFNHPFFSVTGKDGKYTITGLDPGTYEITAWHERLPPQTATVTVGAKETKSQNFKFAVTAK